MQIFIIASVLASVAVTLAMPGGGGSGGGGGGSSGGGGGSGGNALCSPVLHSNAQCCATDVLGIADLDCAPRKILLRL